MSSKIILADTSAAVVAAWREQFAETPEADIREESVLETAAPALLLPGNSFGFLDSGLELEATELFGMDLQDRIRHKIREEHAGELLVGQALAVPAGPAAGAGDARTVVYAPIWRVPRRLDQTVNVFLAVRAALSALDRAGLEEIALPALGVDAGGLEPLVSARQIRYAFEIHIGRRGTGDKNLTQVARRERKLRAVPGARRTS